MFEGSEEARFWARVEKSDGCWLWTGSFGTRGYGSLSIGDLPRRAHRAAWVLTFGPIPDGLNVCHRCDTPPCVRPDHLFLGTDRDNTLDAARKGRLFAQAEPIRALANLGRRDPQQGEAHSNHKLTNDQVREIRQLAASGIPTKVIGPRFGVTVAHIRDLVARRRWAHIE